MSTLPFKKEKRTTPDEFQAQYNAQFRQELRRALPWILLVSLIPALGLPVAVAHQGIAIGSKVVLASFSMYGLSVLSGWLVFIEPYRPRRDQGKETRQILDNGDYWEREQRRDMNKK